MSKYINGKETGWYSWETEHEGFPLQLRNFRVLFLLAKDAIQVYAVKDRKEAYE